MIADDPDVPARLAPFLAQWDYMSEQLMGRLDSLTDTEFLWEPAPVVWTVRERDGRTLPERATWDPTPDAQPPRTLAWSIDHLAWGCLIRADWLDGPRSMAEDDLDWPVTAEAGLTFLRAGLHAWRAGIGRMTDADLDSIGRCAYPDGLDPTLPLLDIVWWVNKELLEHAAEIWYVRDLYRAVHGAQG